MARTPVWHIEIRQTEKYAFVVDPDSRPKVRYIKTHRCVYYTPCHLCGARVSEPCVGSSGEAICEVHSARRDVFYQRITKEVAIEQGKIRKRFGAARKRRAS